MRVVLTISMVLLIAPACMGESTSQDRLSVVVSFYPLEEAALRAGGDHVEVVDLTPPGVEAHDLELSPDDLERIGAADLLLYLGGGFQPAVEDATSQVSGAAIDVIPAVGSLRPDPERELASDPHVWLDPMLYAAVVAAVADALAQQDPVNADTYRANATAFSAELATLDQRFAEGLSACRQRLLVTGHEAFGYLADAYGLEQIGVAGVSPEAEPTPEHLAEVRDLVQQQGVTTVFAEARLPQDAVDAIASETGASVAVLDPLETGTADAEEYVTRMERNLAAIRSGLSCD